MCVIILFFIVIHNILSEYLENVIKLLLCKFKNKTIFLLNPCILNSSMIRIQINVLIFNMDVNMSKTHKQ